MEVVWDEKLEEPHLGSRGSWFFREVAGLWPAKVPANPHYGERPAAPGIREEEIKNRLNV
jgi:hypothetical protein